MSKPDHLSAYLSELAGALEVLGPDEVNEIIREIFSDVKEAASENEVELSGTLERLGPPKILAQRILEERGVLSGIPPFTEPPAWMCFAAYAIDAVVWLVTLLFAGLLALGITAGISSLSSRPGETAGRLVFVVAFGVLAAAWTWFYFVFPLRNGRSIRVGFGVMGLRRARVGSTSRIVRISAIPGSSSRGLSFGRLLWIVAAMVALAFAVQAVSAFLADRDSALSSAVRDSAEYTGTAASAVAGVYRLALLGSPVADIEKDHQVANQIVLDELVSRVKAGEAASWDIARIRVANPEQVSKSRESTPDHVDVNVTVSEYSKTGDAVMYTYAVRLQWSLTKQKSSGSVIAVGSEEWSQAVTIESVSDQPLTSAGPGGTQ